VIAVLDHVATPDAAWNSAAPQPGTSSAPYRIYNIGNQRPISLLRFIEVLEQCLGREAQKNFLPLQPGDVPDTCADVEALVRNVGYRPGTQIEEGVSRFVEWYLGYYRG
jgi:UDP-glucuronate 4-epimerase